MGPQRRRQKGEVLILLRVVHIRRNITEIFVHFSSDALVKSTFVWLTELLGRLEYSSICMVVFMFVYVCMYVQYVYLNE